MLWGIDIKVEIDSKQAAISGLITDTVPALPGNTADKGVQMDRASTQCIYHILMWNYKDDVPAEERARLEAELEALPEKVPALRGVHWGPVTGGRNQSFSHCFVMLFDDQAGLDVYATHPDHLHFSIPFREACAVQVVVDFEG